MQALDLQLSPLHNNSTWLPQIFQQLSPRLLVPILVVPGIRSSDMLPVLGRSGTRMACMTTACVAATSSNSSFIGPML
jgi:hypothetical protein